MKENVCNNWEEFEDRYFDGNIRTENSVLIRKPSNSPSEDLLELYRNWRPEYSKMICQKYRGRLYRNLIDSYYWKVISNAIKLLHPTCDVCGNKATEVHHTDYSLVGCELFNLMSGYLVPVCRDCHQKISDGIITLSTPKKELVRFSEEAFYEAYNKLVEIERGNNASTDNVESCDKPVLLETPQVQMAKRAKKRVGEMAMTIDNGYLTLKTSIINNSQHRKATSTSIAIDKHTQWDDNNKRVINHPHSEIINQFLSDAEEWYRNVHKNINTEEDLTNYTNILRERLYDFHVNHPGIGLKKINATPDNNMNVSLVENIETSPVDRTRKKFRELIHLTYKKDGGYLSIRPTWARHHRDFTLAKGIPEECFDKKERKVKNVPDCDVINDTISKLNNFVKSEWPKINNVNDFERYAQNCFNIIKTEYPNSVYRLKNPKNLKPSTVDVSNKTVVNFDNTINEAKLTILDERVVCVCTNEPIIRKVSDGFEVVEKYYREETDEEYKARVREIINKHYNDKMLYLTKQREIALSALDNNLKNISNNLVEKSY